METDFKYLILKYLLLLCILATSMGLDAQNQQKQGKPVPEAFCIKPGEMELYTMINNYRQKSGLPAIPLSNSLCYIAALHARDLMLNPPDDQVCNFHSWSGKSFWTPFCYPRDESKKQSVWDKPREITKYPSRAFEIIYWENADLTPDSVISVWTSEQHYLNFLLNQGKWQDQQWKAIGVAVLGNYACAWFGPDPDPEGPAFVCGEKPKAIDKKDTLKKQPVNKKKMTAGKAPSISSDSLKAQPAVAESWYVIVKTNITEQAATKLILQLNAAGFPNASIMKKDGKIRVAASGPADKPTAATTLKEIKKTYKDAWLLKQ
jgi:hypothetical protein